MMIRIMYVLCTCVLYKEEYVCSIIVCDDSYHVCIMYMCIIQRGVGMFNNCL